MVGFQEVVEIWGVYWFERRLGESVEWERLPEDLWGPVGFCVESVVSGYTGSQA